MTGFDPSVFPQATFYQVIPSHLSDVMQWLLIPMTPRMRWRLIVVVAGMAKIKGATVVGLSVAPVYYGGYLPHPDNRLTPSWNKPLGISLPHICFSNQGATHSDRR